MRVLTQASAGRNAYLRSTLRVASYNPGVAGGKAVKESVDGVTD